MPRKKKNVSKENDLPKIKLWKFEVKPFDKRLDTYWVLWCEKGKVESEINISISDYEFLAPFMDDKKLAALFWPQIESGEKI